MLPAATLSSYDKSGNYEKSCRLHGSDSSLPESSLSDIDNNQCTQVDNCCSCDKSDTEPLYVCLLEKLCFGMIERGRRPRL